MCVCDLSKYVNQTAGSKALLVVATLSCVVNTIHSDLRHKTCSGEVIMYLEMQSPKVTGHAEFLQSPKVGSSEGFGI